MEFWTTRCTNTIKLQKCSIWTWKTRICSNTSWTITISGIEPGTNLVITSPYNPISFGFMHTMNHFAITFFASNRFYVNELVLDKQLVGIRFVHYHRQERNLYEFHYWKTYLPNEKEDFALDIWSWYLSRTEVWVEDSKFIMNINSQLNKLKTIRMENHADRPK